MTDESVSCAARVSAALDESEEFIGRAGEAERIVESARLRLACVAESMTEHAYQELASALEGCVSMAKRHRVLTTAEVVAGEERNAALKPRRAPDSSQGEIVQGKVRVVCGGPSVATGLGCCRRSDYAPIVSPAAPTLTRVEQLEAAGWTCDAGSFASMLLGISVLCPTCSAQARKLRR